MARVTATAIAAALRLNKGRNKTRNAILVKTIKKYYSGGASPSSQCLAILQPVLRKINMLISVIKFPTVKFRWIHLRTFPRSIRYCTSHPRLCRKVRYIKALSHKRRITSRLQTTSTKRADRNPRDRDFSSSAFDSCVSRDLYMSRIRWESINLLGI